MELSKVFFYTQSFLLEFHRIQKKYPIDRYTHKHIPKQDIHLSWPGIEYGTLKVHAHTVSPQRLLNYIFKNPVPKTITEIVQKNSLLILTKVHKT